MIARPVTPSDHEQWLVMRRTLWPDCADAEHVQEMLDYAQDPRLMTLVAEAPEGRLVGFLEVKIREEAPGCTSTGVGYLEGWYVDAAFRQQGIGGMLVHAAEDWARSKGCTEMASDCDLINDVSLAAHQGLGYREECRLIHFAKRLA
jgi:aminoglycoside 6'-N-acetyltransferase I